MKKRIVKRMLAMLLMTAMLLAGVTVSAWAAGTDEQRVYDQAGLFTENECMELENQIQALKKETKMDFVVVTTDRANGRSAAKYADDFYEQGGFGTGNENSGALFLIDMDNRELYICTAGAMIRYLTDERIEDLQDMAYDYAVDGAYGDAAQAVLSGMESFYKKGIPGNQYTYDVDTGKVVRHRSIRWYEFLLAFAAAAICGVTAVGIVRREYAMKSERTSAAGFNMAYRANAEFVYRTQNDKLVNSIVTHQIIPKTNSGGGFPGGGFSGGGSGAGRSTVHHTSGGNMHGGGGRKF